MPSSGDSPGDSGYGNRLIQTLPARKRASLVAECEEVELDPGSMLCESGSVLDYAYFPLAGTISVSETVEDQRPFEIESIGNEGMFGVALMLERKPRSESCMARGPCRAWRIRSTRLQKALQHDPALGRILQRYLYFVFLERSRTAACIRFHDAGQRMACKLLRAQDRAEADEILLTHQMLADMLGVQRGAISVVAIRWQEEGVIRYSRGRIRILDRKKLKTKACSCYELGAALYTSLVA
jgi:CRP-like cAMP-binding protein